VLIHCPHNRVENPQNEVMFLNINRKITSVVTGMLNPALQRDVLMVGTQTSLMVYDVEENADLFFKEVHDGVNVIAFGHLPAIEQPVCVVGGNCSVQAFDAEGSELYWTVTGDNVSSLAFCDVDDDGHPELLVGTEDFEIRALKSEEVLKEITETDVVIRIKPLHKCRFAYALMHGTVGVYDKLSRAWRVKSKNRVNCIDCFDLDNDGVPELIAGWENGKVEVRNEKSGEVMCKDYFQAPVAALVHADYRLDGRETLMCLTSEGDVRGWLPSSWKLSGWLARYSGWLAACSGCENDNWRDLQAQKAKLTQERRSARWSSDVAEHRTMFAPTPSTRPCRVPWVVPVGASNGPVLAAFGVKAIGSPSRPELASFKEQLKQYKSDGKETGQGVIPTDTKLNASLKANKAHGTVELHLMTTNYSVIRAVVIFAEHLFDGEACMLHPLPPSNNVIVQISPAKDVQTTMSIKAMTGVTVSSVQYHVFELNYVMPKFAMYHQVDEAPVPSGTVNFVVQDRVRSWLQRSFISIPEQMPAPSGANVLEVNFISLRTNEPLCITVSKEQAGLMTIRTDDMETAGEMVQDLCNFLQVTELESTANFPAEMEKFQQVLTRVDEYNAVRMKLTAEMADSANLVKALIVKAEDYRMLSDMQHLKKAFSSLQQTNSDLIAEYNKRANNHQQLLAQLKEVNMMIQKAMPLFRDATHAESLRQYVDTYVEENDTV
ncbi:Bardet-Biedl syndrome 2 protein homolog, partial [Durusdinium trenchii]